MLLKNYIVCCHKDKILTNNAPTSQYDCYIQAGAALTDKRICELNDHDGFEGSISDRNARYSEATAMYYISRHIESDYIGIAHYRRRLVLEDATFNDLAMQGVDIITSHLFPLEKPIDQLYREQHYSADWDLFLTLLQKYDSQDFDFDKKVFSEASIHPANLHIFKADHYRAFANWAFPILDAFYKSSPSKYDLYQNRDVGFIAERLSHLFIMKAKRDGLQIYEAGLNNLATSGSSFDPTNAEEAYQKCCDLYAQRSLTACSDILKKALVNGLVNESILMASEIFKYVNREMSAGLPQVLTDYLPLELKSNLDTLISTYSGLKKIVSINKAAPSAEAKALLQQYISTTGFSYLIVDDLMSNS